MLLANELFASYGLVIVDANNKELKNYLFHTLKKSYLFKRRSDLFQEVIQNYLIFRKIISMSAKTKALLVLPSTTFPLNSLNESEA